MSQSKGRRIPRNISELALQKWILFTCQGNTIRHYLQTYVYRTRHQLVSCFFQDEFTLGHSTTQILESWNNLIKMCLKGSNMSELVIYIETLCEEQRKFDHTRQCYVDSTSTYRNIPIVYETELQKVINNTGLSKFSAKLLAEEFKKAELLCF